jgi:hypothetical protein
LNTEIHKYRSCNWEKPICAIHTFGDATTESQNAKNEIVMIVVNVKSKIKLGLSNTITDF